jgi:hypothetical protein
MITAGLGMVAARRNRAFRQPTPRERDDIARPLARIAVRHLPLDLIGDDLADITEATVATHDYVSAGPLLTLPNPDDEPLFADEYSNDEEP